MNFIDFLLTPIPNKLSILEQSFVFIPKPRVESKTSTANRPNFNNSRGDTAIPITLASCCLFNYLCPLRAMRQQLSEDLLLFFMRAPTFGFTLTIFFVPHEYTFRNIVGLEANCLKPGEKEKIQEKTLRALKELGEKGTYITQLVLVEVDLEDCRRLVLSDVLPKLHRLESLTFGNWPYQASHVSQFASKRNELAISKSLTTVFASTPNLVVVSLYFTGADHELEMLLRQVSRSLRQLTLAGQVSYNPHQQPSESRIDTKIINILTKCVPRLTKLVITEVTIDTGFFKAFSEFTSNLRHLQIVRFKIESTDPLEFQYLQQYHGHSLDCLQFESVLSLSSTSRGEYNPLLALTGGLSCSPSDETSIHHSESVNAILPFPCVRTLSLTNAIGRSQNLSDCYPSLNYHAFPSLTKLDLSCNPLSHIEYSFTKLFDTVIDHGNLEFLSLPSAAFDASASLSTINDRLNRFGENLRNLRELHFSCKFPHFSDSELSEAITFEGWKYLTKLEKLRTSFVNDNLLQVAGEFWRERFEFFTCQAGVFSSESDSITDDGLVAFANITRPPSLSSKEEEEEENNNNQHHTPRFKSFFAVAWNGITDEGAALFLEKFRTNSSDKNYFTGIKDLSFANCKNIGPLTCKALAEYHHESCIDFDCQGTQVDESCFKDLAKCTKLECVFFDNPSISDPESFLPLAEALQELMYLDLYSCDAISDDREKIDRLHDMFEKQIRNVGLYIGNNRT